MALRGEAAKRLEAINRLSEGGGSITDINSLFNRINRGRVGDSDIWENLSPTAIDLLGLQFVGGSLMRVPKRREVAVAGESGLPRRLLGPRANLGVDDKLARYRFRSKEPVRIAQFPEVYEDSHTATAKAELVVRCASVQGVPLQYTEHEGKGWESMAVGAEALNLPGIAEMLAAKDFNVNSPKSRAVIQGHNLEDTGQTLISVTTNLLNADRRVVLGAWKGGSSREADNKVGIEVVDFFEVSMGELSGYLPNVTELGQDGLSGEVQAVLEAALAAREESLLTPLASAVVMNQEVKRI